DLTATDTRTPPRACRDMYSGALEDNAQCFFAGECASGACEIAPGCTMSACCSGSCVPTPTVGRIGDACDAPLACVDTFCATRGDHRCHVFAALNEQCLDDDRSCTYGLFCVTGTCRVAPHLGEPCPYQRCADEGLRCDLDTATCVRLGLPGDACAMFTDCS